MEEGYWVEGFALGFFSSVSFCFAPFEEDVVYCREGVFLVDVRSGTLLWWLMCN